MIRKTISLFYCEEVLKGTPGRIIGEEYEKTVLKIEIRNEFVNG